MGEVAILGIDCATRPEKTGLALGYARGERATIVRCGVASTSTPVAAIVADWLGGCDRVLLALDSPLGWPQVLADCLPRHEAGARLPASADELFRRRTDSEIRSRLGLIPLEVAASWLARTAAATLVVLDEIRQQTGHVIPLAWAVAEPENWRAIEVYPAATRAAYGAPAGSGSVAGLDDVLDWSRVDEHVRRSEHIGDACVCVLAGADFLLGRAVPPDDFAVAEREGWIWARGLRSIPPGPRDSGYRPVGRREASLHALAGEPPAGAASTERSASVACRACQKGMPFELPRRCPQCGKVFMGRNWEGIDGHWKANHQDVLPYRVFWDTLCAEHRRVPSSHREDAQ